MAPPLAFRAAKPIHLQASKAAHPLCVPPGKTLFGPGAPVGSATVPSREHKAQQG